MPDAIAKLLVANRGEIAIRAFRAAVELGITTVAVHTHADRNSLHRLKADEAYQIGDESNPLRAYLDPDAIVAAAVAAGADAVYPGYGFLSESPLLADACAAAGLTFVGPSPATLRLTGNKRRAHAAAAEAGLPVLAQSEAFSSPDEVGERASVIGFPLYVKAAAGGGGRGVRRVDGPAELVEAVGAATREAEKAFGDPTVFLEQAVHRPRHIEVQVLGDRTGEIVHLWERDCSLQRRHQKVIEVAPARDLDPDTRRGVTTDAVAFARAVGYENAGTVEFLVDGAGRHVFIEMNPRIQVEHTVTEEVTDVDLVQAQLRLAGGETLADLGLDQDTIGCRGFALQCRVTTEDPGNGFRPDTGRIVAYRQPGGAGIRLDGGGGYAGAEVTPYFDSLLVKATCRGRTFPEAVARARRALAEFRVRGLNTNLAFLRAVLDDPEFLAGPVSTAFLDERPDLLRAEVGADRGTRLLRFLGDVTVNPAHDPRPAGLVDPVSKLPLLPGGRRTSPNEEPPDRRGRPASTVGRRTSPNEEPPDRRGRPASTVGRRTSPNEEPPDRRGRPASTVGRRTSPNSPDRRGRPADAASRQRLTELGPAGFARWMRDETAVLVTDTTFRDAHQSVLATRMRTTDLVAGAAAVAHTLPGLLSLEAWGGATFDVALRFLHEDPWERLDRIRAAAPNVCLQMLLRGRNTVGYTAYPEIVARRFVAEATRTGIDIFRIFDALNDVEAMRPAIEAVLEAGAVAEGTLCYSGDLVDPAEDLYTLDHYLPRAEALVEAGCHVLCVKDMAGLLRAPAAALLVRTLRDRFDLPVHLHTHDTAGGQLATYAAAIAAGVDAVDGAAGPLAGMTSQPALGAIVAATDATERATGLSLSALGDLEPYWEAVRRLYAPFDSGLGWPTGTVYRHEIPGGQLSNLRQQADALGLGHRFEDVEERYAAVDTLLGRIIKVTPTSKVVGDLALHLVASGLSTDEVEADPAAVDLPDSVIGFLHGELGTPAGGFPEPFRTRALEGRRPRQDPGRLDPADRDALDGPRVRETLNRLLFPGPAADLAGHRERYGDVSVVPTEAFLYGLRPGHDDVAIELEPGVRLLVGLDAVGEADERGMRQLVFRINGQPRAIEVLDTGIDTGVAAAEKADPGDPGHVGAPFRGVVTPVVTAGDEVAAGETVATIEAMKMESTIGAPVAGTVSRLALTHPAAVEPGDLILVVSPP